MSETVSNPTGDKNEKIKHVADLLKSSPQVRAVFDVVYRGKKQYKTVDEIKASVPNFNTNTYVAAAKLAAEDIFDKKVINGLISYGKKQFYTHNKDTIIKLSKNPKRLKSFLTKRNPRVEAKLSSPVFRFLGQPRAEQLHVDDIDSFSKVKKVSKGKPINLSIVAERAINEGICKILEKSSKNDWGGEKNDIFGTVIFVGKRKTAAFALKGKATQGILVPAKMGKNGDQIPRLFESVAEIHVVVYHSEVAESIYDMMKSQAISKSTANGSKKIYFCVIDGKDLQRLVWAYPKEFGLN